MIAKGAHSPRGPSSAERWWNCPASVAATQDVPEKKSMYAIIGTAAHTASEWTRLQQVPAKTFLNDIVHVQWGEDQTEAVTVDQEMTVGVQEFVDYCDQFPGKPYYELMIEYGEYVTGGFGTLDDLRLAPVCDITDFKYGTGHQVYAKKNKQLMLYALGVYLKFKNKIKFKKFRLHIHQPRLGHIDMWPISVKDLLTWAEEELRPAGLRTEDPNASFKAGEWCAFCKIKTTCMVRANYILQNPADEFENLDLAVDKISIGDEVSPITLSNDQVARILSIKSTVISWYSELEKHALSELSKGHPVGDYKIVEGRSYRTYNMQPADVAIALSFEGFKEEDIWEKTLISPAQLEKKVGKRSKVIEDFFDKPPGAPTLVPGSDRRDPLTLKAELEFENLDEIDSLD